MRHVARNAVLMTLATAMLAAPASKAGVVRGACDPPQVLIVLDKSSSMVTGNDSNGVTKWASATAAVETLVTSYGDRIDFGLMVFPYLHQCSPGSVVVGVGPGTAPAIVSFLRNAPPESGNYTPMSQSLDVAAGYAPLFDPDRRSFVLLVTDGWQYCVPYDASTRFDAVESVENLYWLGVDTFVLGFGDAVDVLNNNYMAEAGGQALPGCNPYGDDPHANDLCYHQTGNQAELEAAFDDIALVVTEEICDGRDNDCDGYTDNLVPGSPDPLKNTVTQACGTCDSLCIGGQWQPCTAEGPCNDGNACTTNDWCVGDVCQGQPVTCNDGNLCTDDSCDPARGCVFTPNHAACDDGDPCTSGDVCSQGTCAGNPITCNDGNLCTDDSCDPARGCVYLPNHGACDDGDPCTFGDVCTQGSCSGDPIDCDDGDICTTDFCDPAVGCRSEYNHAPCDDGDPCTANDRCEMGVCRGTPFDCNNDDLCDHQDCNDANFCTDDFCDNAIGCYHENNDNPCDDGDPCTENDRCVDGVCQGTPFDCGNGDPCEGIDCDDGNPCTDDRCDSGLMQCLHTPNNNACDDGDECTYDDVCTGGVCGGTPVNCDDGNPCTEDLCVPGPCDGDACDPNGCIHRPRSGPCDDGDPCTEGDSCQSGMCQGGVDVCATDQTDPGGGTAAGCGCSANAQDDPTGTAGLLPGLLLLLIARRRTV